MGCAPSKRIKATVDAYRPPPTSFAVFDINAIEEPWLKHLNTPTTTLLEPQDKPKRTHTHTHVPAPILQKLNMLEATEAPQPWAEVSKALEDLKPIVKLPSTSPPPPPPPQSQPQPPPPPRKSVSFHTIEELDAKLTTKPKPELKNVASAVTSKNSVNSEPPPPQPAPIELEEGGSRIKPVRENIFILKDRLERQKEEKASIYDKIKRDPLSQFPEKCPPGGSDAVVIYTTSLGGVRKTFEDCNRARDVLEGHRVVFDERDVSLHGDFLRELKELLGEEVALPKVFLKGRYVGGLKELVELNESGRLGRILNATHVERGIGRQACGGCGGARFVPCLECGGSCKVVLSGVNKERCPKCNENGLVHCPACLSH